jgi:hypothetical protein
MKVTVIQDLRIEMRPSLTRKVTNLLTIPIYSEMEYELPIIINSDDIRVEHRFQLPRYANFTFPRYRFNPILITDLGFS